MFSAQFQRINPLKTVRKGIHLCVFILLALVAIPAFSQTGIPVFHYIVSIPEPSSHTFNVELRCSNWGQDSIHLKMPNWMPGYYQILNYAKSVENLKGTKENGESISVEKVNDNTWAIFDIKNKSFSLKYTVKTQRRFVANSYVDSTYAYIIPGSAFLYAEGVLNNPVSVELQFSSAWENVATGLFPMAGKPLTFMADDFDILYDCPILIGNLEELPPFEVERIEHRFVGRNIGTFDQTVFMANLKKVVETASGIIGDIPYKKYTFIAIGPGRGGIEHLNNTTVSFDGNELSKPGAMNRIMNFLAHEYFHHYNVKRIRPFELGPFDYDNGSRTNLLWVSEGLSVYYEYLIVKRAGLVDAETLLSFFDQNLNAHENDSGRFYQSLQQASYRTWSDGPFGRGGDGIDKAISYYDKGPLLGLLFDFEIRNATQNRKSLDDVMRFLYWKYYKVEQRGFTEAEFQQACEQVAGTDLTSLFEYVYTTRELDYNKYLGYAGMQIDKQMVMAPDNVSKERLTIKQIPNPDASQLEILKSWMGE